MKPLTIKAGTLVKIGLCVAVVELAADIGKAAMLKAVKKINSETANEVLEALDAGINSNKYHGLKKCKLKIVRGMCKACTND